MRSRHLTTDERETLLDCVHLSRQIGRERLAKPGLRDDDRFRFERQLRAVEALWREIADADIVIEVDR